MKSRECDTCMKFCSENMEPTGPKLKAEYMYSSLNE